MGQAERQKHPDWHLQVLWLPEALYRQDRTIFEASHVKLNLWLQAIYLMCGSKKGTSINQLHRTLGVTLKTAWFISHRIREAMKPDIDGEGPAGWRRRDCGGGRNFPWHWPRRFRAWPGLGWCGGKIKILTLVERNGRAYSMKGEHITAK